MARACRDIAGQLCARLLVEGRAARRFELAYHRLDGRAERRVIGLSLPLLRHMVGELGIVVHELWANPSHD